MYKNKDIKKYDGKLAIKSYRFFRNIYNWDNIEEWQNERSKIFPDNIIINNKDLDRFKKYFNNIINNANNYIDSEIKEILDQIISSKAVKNPNVPLFKIFDQPLFYYFVNKNITIETKEFLKRPSSVIGKTLIPEYDNYTDKKINKNYDYLMFFNDKSVLIEKDGHSSSMSYLHLLCIFNKKMYNCVSLNKNHYKILIKTKNDIIKFINKDDNFIKCLSEFGTRTIVFKLQNKTIFETDLLENNDISKLILKILEKVYNKFKNNKYNTIDIYKELLMEFKIISKKEIKKDLEFYFHIHPFHSVGYLHMHCIYTPLKTKSWNHFITQFIKIEDLVK